MVKYLRWHAGGLRHAIYRKTEGEIHMLRIAICDDETDARDALRIQLEKLLILSLIHI